MKKNQHSSGKATSKWPYTALIDGDQSPQPNNNLRPTPNHDNRQGRIKYCIPSNLLETLGACR